MGSSKEYLQRKERRRRLRKYGLEIEDYDAHLATQKGVCASCYRPPTTRRLSVFFNKKTQTVYGLVCVGCMAVIRATWGSLDTKAAKLAAVGNYLERLQSEFDT